MKYYSLFNNSLNSQFGEIANNIIIEKKSKFISYLFTTNTSEESNKYIEELKAKYNDSRHVVYIYSNIQNNIANIRFSDDGEPKGTGTKAIYELLEKEKISNICIVIIRYFGGILLGAGPLSRTYLNAARSVIEQCERKEIYIYNTKTYELEYSHYNNIIQIIDEYKKNEHIIITNIQFNDKININIEVVNFLEMEIDTLFMERKYD